ncbi:MAG: MarR family transcriptional regulator [Candidatus Riflebacteria bacterium]|nr:MarR family transcriptional regulator [Candidatus Riflebacteria bacterium]
MKHGSITALTRALIEIAWFFGPKGASGRCCEDLAMPEFLALVTIADLPDCPVQEIGAALGFTKSGATRIVDRLERKGYVTRVKSPDDARVCCVVITPRGRNILETTDARYQESLKAVLARLPGEETPAVRKMITMLARAMRS